MSGIFGGGGGIAQQIAPTSTPTVVAPAPDRTDAATQALAARQKARFNGAGSFTNNYLTGGQDKAVSTTSKLLGGGS